MFGVFLLAAGAVAASPAPLAEPVAIATAIEAPAFNQAAPAGVEAPAGGAFAGAIALDEKLLSRESARENLNQIATSNQTAQVSKNSINGPSVTGSVSFDGQAFSNFNGLSIVGANSGNNVAFNSSLNVNISIQSAK